MEKTIVCLLALCCWTTIHLIHGNVYINDCIDGVIRTTEGGGHEIGSTIGSVSSYDDLTVVQWTIRWRDQPAQEINCEFYDSGNYQTCNSSDVEGIEIQFLPSYYYYYNQRMSVYMYIYRTERSMMNFSCNVTIPEQNYTDGASCSLDVIYPAEVDFCQFTVDKQLWSAVGSCHVTKVYSSMDIYGLSVLQGYDGIYEQTNVSVDHTRNLESYINTTSGLTYYGGKFPFSVPLYPYTGKMTMEVTVYPGGINIDLPTSVNVEPPADPTLTDCDQVVIVEGETLAMASCRCRVESLGSPTGRLRWLSDGEVVATGVYGVEELPFPYEIMDRTRLGQTMNCQVDWIASNESASFIPEFVYGPDTAVIFVSGNDANDANMTLLCTSLQVQPLSALNITWGGLCEGQKGRTCSLTTPVSVSGETEVTCTATNQMFPRNQVTVKWSQKVDGGHAQKSEEDRSLWKGVGIGVGGTLFVVLVVVAVLLVVLLRRGLLPACQCCIPTYARPSNRNQGEEEEHTYSDMSIYESVKDRAASTRAGKSRKQDRPVAASTASDDFYVNTGADL